MNPVNERDLYMMQGLKNLGIKRGKPFYPTVKQASILKQATVGMRADIVGVGSKYLASYKDDAGEWLDGAHTYQLFIPLSPQKWSFS